MDIGFDEILHTPIVSTDNLGVSNGGQHVVSSSLYSDTFSEHPAKNAEEPVKIVNGSSDTIGFFGRNVYMLAIASGDVLRIIDYFHLDNIMTMRIRPGSLFVPDNANSRYIGVVSPSGRAVIIDDEGEIIKTPLVVDEGYTVLWSPTVRPVGYLWSDESSVNLYVRSTPDDKGSVLSSTKGISVFGIWSNPHLRRHEVYISTYDQPNILKRVSSSNDGAVVEDAIEMEEGTFINQVVTLSNGKPSLVVGYKDAKVVSEVVEPSTKVGMLMKSIVDDESRMTYPKIIGSSAFVSWTQTPATVPVAAVTLYSNEGRPRYEIKGNALEENVIIPETNEVRSFDISNKEKLSYRIVSPFTTSRHMAKNVVIIADDDGLISAGKYSPTVRTLYELGVPVVLVPVRKDRSRKIALKDLVFDLVDVSRDLRDRDITSRVTVMGGDELCTPIIEALRHKHTKIDSAILVNPHNSVVRNIGNKKLREKVVSAYFSVNEEDIHNNGVYRFIPDGLDNDETKHEVSLFLREFVV